MNAFKQARNQRQFSQRQLASMTGIAYKTVQRIESERHNPRLSTLQALATTLGYPKGLIKEQVDNIFRQSPLSLRMISEQIFKDGEGSWKIWLFNFVDHLRQHPSADLIDLAPTNNIPKPMGGLLTATVETLCDEKNWRKPSWCEGMPILPEPWFVSATENLKASALVESPVHFRKRNIFVLGNFLERR